MNHPSDYMNNFEDDLSSDSSNPTIKMLPHPKSRATQSLHHPHPHPRPHPTKKSTKQSKLPKKNKMTQQRQKARAVSDYLILGDSYIKSAKVREVTRRFVEEQQKEATLVMRVQRLKRKEKKSILKIEAYIQTFVQGMRITRSIQRLPPSNKLALYQLLKAQKQQQLLQEETIDSYFQLAVQRLERLTGQYQQDFPHRNRVIAKWKNYKMHQLSSAKCFLTHQTIDNTCDLQNQLALLEEETFFPELREEAEDLRQSIATHLKEEAEKKNNQEDSGVKWVLSRLLKFILQRDQVLTSILDHLQQGCLPLLDDGLFILFEREVIGNSEDEGEAQQQRYIHMFNKAIFDMINETAPALLPQCPYISVDEVIRWLFELAPKFEMEEKNELDLLGMAQEVWDGLLEEALWDFLQCF